MPSPSHVGNLTPTSRASTSKSEHDDKHTRRQRQSRTQRACDNCRKRKVRCTGEPRCQNCVDQNATCVYTQARRDRLNEATEQNSKLVALLKDLTIHVDISGKMMIDEHLDMLGEDDYTPASVPSLRTETSGAAGPPGALGKRSREASPSDERPRQGGPQEAIASESAGADDYDFLDEDLLRSRESRATGFIGTNSSMQWMRSLKSQMGNSASDTTRNVVLHVSDSTFYLDHNDLQLELDDVMVDPYELPRPEVAERLFDSYIRTVHASFPILPHVFEDQFRKYNESAKRGRPYQVPEEWQAMLNLVMAIGAQYSHLMQAKWRAGANDHLIYMIRAARILRLDKLATSLPSPSLSFIQSTGLLALYYLTIGQVSRAWMTIGISLRFALAAGLHLRNEDPSAPATKSETLVRTWWSLHSIETLLCAIIGRPCVIPNNECTVPLPQDLPQLGESPLSLSSDSTNTSRRGDSDEVTRSSFLGARVTIALIMQKALHKLYTPRISADSWDSIQTDITSLITELDNWAGAAHLAGVNAKIVFEDGVDRHNLLLAFHYQSTKLLICRPCLCRLERRKGQSDASVQMNQLTAEACVAAAQAIAWLLPDEPDRTFVYEQTPWWSTVHIIMQAVAVLMLKMSFGEQHMNHRGEQLTGSVRKLIRWLRRLSATSAVAERAYHVTVDIVKISAPRVRIDINTPTKEEPSSESPPRSSVGPAYPDPPHQSFAQTEWDRLYPARPISNDAASTKSFSPASTVSNSQFSSPAQHRIPNMGKAQAQYLNAVIGTQQQHAQEISNFQFEHISSLDPGSNMPLFFGNPFLTNFDQPGPLFNGFVGSVQVNMEAAFDPYTDHNQEA